MLDNIFLWGFVCGFVGGGILGFGCAAILAAAKNCDTCMDEMLAQARGRDQSK